MLIAAKCRDVNSGGKGEREIDIVCQFCKDIRLHTPISTGFQDQAVIAVTFFTR